MLEGREIIIVIVRALSFEEKDGVALRDGQGIVVRFVGRVCYVQYDRVSLLRYNASKWSFVAA